MQKRGQLSIFILLGAIIVIAVAFFLYTQQEPSAPVVQLPGNIQTAKASFESCIDAAASSAVGLQAMQGGALLPEQSVAFGPVTIGFAYVNGAPTLPTADQMEDDLDAVLPFLLSTCTDDLEDQAALLGVGVSDADATVDARVGQKLVSVSVDYPVELSSGDVVTTVGARVVNVERPIGALRDAAENIVFDTTLDPAAVPIGELLDLPYTATLVSALDQAAIYSLVDEASGTTFMFAIEIPENDGLEANPIEPFWLELEGMQLTAGQQFSGGIGAVSPLGLPITYTSDTHWVNVDPLTGKVSATADAMLAGTHVVVFTATDSEGRSIEGSVEVVVA